MFKVGKYQWATKKYDKDAKYIEHDNSFSTEEKNKSNWLRMHKTWLSIYLCKYQLIDTFDTSLMMARMIFGSLLKFHKKLLKRCKSGLFSNKTLKLNSYGWKNEHQNHLHAFEKMIKQRFHIFSYLLSNWFLENRG